MAISDDEAFWAMKARLADLLPRLNERDRPLALAAEAKSWGRGGISAVHEATGVSKATIRRGKIELGNEAAEQPVRLCCLILRRADLWVPNWSST